MPIGANNVMEFSESISSLRSPFSYEDDETVVVLKPRMPKSEGLSYSSDDLLREMDNIEGAEEAGTVDFYGMGNERCEDEDEENWALREDLKNKKEIELQPQSKEPSVATAQQRIPAVDIAIATASPRTKSRLSKLREGAFMTVAKARTDIFKSMTDLGTKIKYTLINKETENTWKDIVALFSEHVSQVPKVDLILGYILLAVYYKENVQRTGNYVTDRTFVESSNYFYRFAYGAYGWKALYGRRRGAKKHFTGLAVKARDGFTQANTDALLGHTGLKVEDLVDVQWKSENFSPGHYVALDHLSKNIIVAIRGTSHMHDFLVDLCGRNDEFEGGLVHSGILKCAQVKTKRFTPILKKLLEKYPDYGIKVVGHSLGGGTAALVTMILAIEHPEWPLLAYCFASPCVVSQNLATRFADKILSFALNNDPISRVSLGSTEALKNTIVQLNAQSETTLQRMFHIVNAGKTLGADFSKKIGTWLKVKAELDLTKINMKMSTAEKLVPPGRIFHVYKKNPTDVHYIMEESVHDYFTEIIISSDMISHHFPNSYEAAWKSLLANDQIWPINEGREEFTPELR